MDQRGNPVLPWLRGWSAGDARADLLAGLTVAAVLVPGSMAYAQVAGLPTEVGLYAATVPVALYALFGMLPAMSIGPIASVSLLAGIAIGRAGPSADAPIAALLALVCAVLFAAVAALRLDRFVDRISEAALLGFVSSIGALILATQIDSLVGLPSDHPHTTWGDLVEVAQDYEQANWWTLGVTLITVLGVLVLERYVRLVPAGLIAIVTGIAATSLLDLQAHGVDVVGELPAGLPGFSFPGTDGVTVSLVPVALGIVVIGLVEMSAIARAAEPSVRTDPHREAVALAAVSGGAGLFGAMPVTGSPSRAVIAARAGARTPFTSLVVALVVGTLLVIGSDWLEDLPIPVVASLVVVAGLRLVRPATWRALWSDDRVGVAVAAIVLTVSLINVEAGVLAVFALSVADARRRRVGGRRRAARATTAGSGDR